MDIADRIKQVRGEMRQVDFATKIDAPKNTVGRWERGEQVPGHDDLCNILDAFADIEPLWLLLGEGPMRRKETVPAPMPSAAPSVPIAAATEIPLQAAAHAHFDALGAVEGMGLLTKIYTSGDQVFIRAINANLLAFSDAIENRARAENTFNAIKEMREQMDEMKGEINELRQENLALQRRLQDKGDQDKKQAVG